MSAAGPARAEQPPAFGLNWLRLEGAESCLSADALAARVEARFGHVMFGPVTGAKLFVDGHVRAGARGDWDVVVELSLPGGRRWGTRRLPIPATDGACSVIDEGVVFVIEQLLKDLHTDRVALDPELERELDRIFGPPQLVPPPIVPAVAAPPGQAPAAAAGPAATERAPREQPADDGSPFETAPPPGAARVDVAAVGGAGLLPGVSFGLAAHAALDPGVIWPLELSAVFMPPRRFTAEAAGGPPADLDLALFSIALALCPLELWGSLAVCAGGELGFVNVQRGSDFSPSDASGHLVAGPIAAAVLRLDLGSRLHLRLSAQAAATLPRNAYVFTGAQGRHELFESWPVAVRGDAGIGLRL